MERFGQGQVEAVVGRRAVQAFRPGVGFLSLFGIGGDQFYA